MLPSAIAVAGSRGCLAHGSPMEQIRVPIPALAGVLGELLAGSEWAGVAARLGPGSSSGRS